MKIYDRIRPIRPTAELVVEANGVRRYATLEKNPSAEAFVDRLSPERTEIELTPAAGEAIGTLPWTLPQCDGMIEAKTGDLLLFGGDRIAICFFDSGTRECTRLAKIDAKGDELLEIISSKKIKFFLEWSE